MLFSSFCCENVFKTSKPKLKTVPYGWFLADWEHPSHWISRITRILIWTCASASHPPPRKNNENKYMFTRNFKERNMTQNPTILEIWKRTSIWWLLRIEKLEFHCPSSTTNPQKNIFEERKYILTWDFKEKILAQKLVIWEVSGYFSTISGFLRKSK